jgi:hypothetical protein
MANPNILGFISGQQAKNVGKVLRGKVPPRVDLEHYARILSDDPAQVKEAPSEALQKLSRIPAFTRDEQQLRMGMLVELQHRGKGSPMEVGRTRIVNPGEPRKGYVRAWRGEMGVDASDWPKNPPHVPTKPIPGVHSSPVYPHEAAGRWYTTDPWYAGVYADESLGQRKPFALRYLDMPKKVWEASNAEASNLWHSPTGGGSALPKSEIEHMGIVPKEWARRSVAAGHFDPRPPPRVGGLPRGGLTRGGGAMGLAAGALSGLTLGADIAQMAITGESPFQQSEDLYRAFQQSRLKPGQQIGPKWTGGTV